MIESTREKTLRMGLIGLCVLIVLGGLFYSSSQVTVPERSVHAEVLSAGGEDRNPVIAVAKMVQDQPVLVIYEIDKRNQYYFKVLHSVSLKKSVKELGVTKDKSGIWAQVDQGQWILFSPSLDVLEERKKSPSSMISSQQSFEYDEHDQLLDISLRERKDPIRVKVSDGEGVPAEVHSLSEDRSLWLVVLPEDLLLAQGR
ncbi:hypothetical protein QTG56_10575 [Rossellomorea sp. AcN35-11]|nr:hypothetical protein [Rossellomorea aquimaris]WJV31326.1 hypothetical protein QTG56_10575 [Rossellomorea sp. AcN35-11]